MEDIQPSKATMPASSHMEEDKVTAETSSSSTLDTFHLNLPESSLTSWHATLRLDTSGQTPSTSVCNEVSTPSSAQASTVSSVSSANLPLPTQQEETERGRHRRRQQQRAGERTAEPLSMSRGAWDSYFHEQEARGVSYKRHGPSPPHSSTATAILPRTMTAKVGFARPPSNFQVLNLQAQHLVIHNSSSGKLVEATVPSIDFSQSAALQNLLLPTLAQAQGPSRSQDNSPPGRPEGRGYQQRSPASNYPPRSRSLWRQHDRRQQDRHYDNRDQDERCHSHRSLEPRHR
jgi:hypothetical protein